MPEQHWPPRVHCCPRRRQIVIAASASRAPSACPPATPNATASNRRLLSRPASCRDMPSIFSASIPFLPFGKPNDRRARASREYRVKPVRFPELSTQMIQKWAMNRAAPPCQPARRPCGHRVAATNESGATRMPIAPDRVSVRSGAGGGRCQSDQRRVQTLPIHPVDAGTSEQSLSSSQAAPGFLRHFEPEVGSQTKSAQQLFGSSPHGSSKTRQATVHAPSMHSPPSQELPHAPQ